MLLRTCLVALAAALGPAAGSRAEPPAAPVRSARESTASLDARRSPWKLRLGVPESPFEAERQLFGFHLRFHFGEDAARGRSARRTRALR